MLPEAMPPWEWERDGNNKNNGNDKQTKKGVSRDVTSRGEWERDRNNRNKQKKGFRSMPLDGINPGQNEKGPPGNPMRGSTRRSNVECGGVLLSHTLSSAVPSPCQALASGFGKGPGVSPGP